MAGSRLEVAEVYLQPGELHLALGPTILKTILGSCVGVTFWSWRLEIGALCHGVLPHCPSGVVGGERYRYVDFAVHHLIREMERCGALAHEVQVKAFGGADVLPVHGRRPWRPTVGQQNCESALNALREENYPVFSSDLGGTAGRTIQFDTRSGLVLVRRLERVDSGRVGAGAWTRVES